MSDLLLIIKRNVLSPIVIAILILATTLLFLNENRDAFFISGVIILNTLIATIQEIRARRALKKLELMSAPHAQRRLQNGDFEDVMYNQLAVGDIVKLHSGDEIPADGIVTENRGLEVDESMLTGESAAIEKENQSNLYAASAVVAGEALMKVTAIGTDTKAGRMTSTLKRYVPQLTPLQHAINRAITFLTYGALGLAVLIFIVYTGSHQNAIIIVKTITSGAVTIVPEGLLLASSLLLAFGSLKLAQAKVLPQKLAAIEAMALLSVLCVDKTGTLTSDTITFEKFDFFSNKHNPKMWRDILSITASSTSGGNATGDAISSVLPLPEIFEVTDTLAFSSQRKMSGVRVRYKDAIHTVFFGAPEFLSPLAPLSEAQKESIKALTNEGKRVLLVASFPDTTTPLKKLAAGSGEAIGVVVLSNPLRTDVEKTVEYLQNNNVSIRVISGDNPETVQYVAKSIGITASQKSITGAELAELSEEAWDKTVLETTIFARVLPEQKERIIATFKKHGEFTGMVGDGVNDALALKKADLGVAMYAGAAATRRVADIVLLNNSFTALPTGMKLGNRIMQAIEVISILFFHKIIYGITLLLATLALHIRYPFQPRHVTFMNLFLVVLPTIMWTLFPPRPKHRIQPRHFWRDTLIAVAPIALLSGVGLTVSYLLMTTLFPQDQEAISTALVLITTFFGAYLVFLAPKLLAMKNNKSARAARIFYVVSVAIFALVGFGTHAVRGFFDFAQPNPLYILPALIVVALVGGIQYILAVKIGKAHERTLINR